MQTLHGLNPSIPAQRGRYWSEGCNKRLGFHYVATNAASVQVYLPEIQVLESQENDLEL